MGMNKTQVAAVMGIDIAAPASLPPSDRPSQSKQGIGTEIIRRASYGKVTVESIQRYLEALRECGIMHRAALAANLSYSAIAKLRKADQEFADEEEAAKQMWIAEKIDDPIYKHGIEGHCKMILDPKTGTLLKGERVANPAFGLAFARKFDHNYREKQELDVKHGGGVVVVTAPMLTDTDLERHARKVESQNRAVIDVDAAPSVPAQTASPAQLPPPA